MVPWHDHNLHGHEVCSGGGSSSNSSRDGSSGGVTGGQRRQADLGSSAGRTAEPAASITRGGAVRRQDAAVQREAVTLKAGGKSTEQSYYEVLLGATVHYSAGWAAMVRDGNASLGACCRAK